MNSEDYNLQDLLEILEEKGSEKNLDLPVKETSKISKFIREFNINSGVDRITTHMIYYTYKEKFGGELSKIAFFREFNKEFIQRRTGKQRVYLLVGDSFDLSREGKLEAEFHNKGSKK